MTESKWVFLGLFGFVLALCPAVNGQSAKPSKPKPDPKPAPKTQKKAPIEARVQALIKALGRDAKLGLQQPALQAYKDLLGLKAEALPVLVQEFKGDSLSLWQKRRLLAVMAKTGHLAKPSVGVSAVFAQALKSSHLVLPAAEALATNPRLCRTVMRPLLKAVLANEGEKAKTLRALVIGQLDHAEPRQALILELSPERPAAELALSLSILSPRVEEQPAGHFGDEGTQLFKRLQALIKKDPTPEVLGLSLKLMSLDLSRVKACVAEFVRWIQSILDTPEQPQRCLVALAQFTEARDMSLLHGDKVEAQYNQALSKLKALLRAPNLNVRVLIYGLLKDLDESARLDHETLMKGTHSKREDVPLICLGGFIAADREGLLSPAEQRQWRTRLLEMVRSPSGRVVEEALLSLRLLTANGSSEPFGDIVKAYVLCLKHSSVEVRKAALDGLRRLGTRSLGASSEVLGCLKDSDADVRLQALRTIAQIHEQAKELPSPVKEALGLALKDADSVVRAAGFEALSDLSGSDSWALPRLLKGLTDQDPDIHTVVAFRLTLIGSRRLKPYIGAFVEPLLKDLTGGTLARRRIAAQVLALCEGHSERILPTLLTQLESSRGALKMALVEALGWLGRGSKLAAQALLPVLKRKPGKLRMQALRAVQNFTVHQDAFIEVLRPRLKSLEAGEELRETLNALRQLDSDGGVLPAVLRLARHRDRARRAEAIKALGFWSPRLAVKHKAAIRALAQAEKDPKLAEALKDTADLLELVLDD